MEAMPDTAWVAMGIGENHTIALLKEHGNKMTPNIFCYTHRSVYLSAIT